MRHRYLSFIPIIIVPAPSTSTSTPLANPSAYTEIAKDLVTFTRNQVKAPDTSLPIFASLFMSSMSFLSEFLCQHDATLAVPITELPRFDFRDKAIVHVPELTSVPKTEVVRATLMTKPQPKHSQGDKGRYENNVQLVQWISSVYTSANNKYMETCLVQWKSSEIKLRRSHDTGRNPKPYSGAYYIIRTNKGKGNINEYPDRSEGVQLGYRRDETTSEYWVDLLLRSCLNIGWSWIGDVGNDQYCW